MGRKVLIVEDEKSICEFMKNMLETKSCEVFIASTAEEAGDILRRERPEACSIDLHLVDSAFDGVNFLKEVRKSSDSVYCLVFTRITDENIMQELKSAGADAVFLKPPSSPDELKNMISQLAAGVREGGKNG